MKKSFVQILIITVLSIISISFFSLSLILPNKEYETAIQLTKERLIDPSSINIIDAFYDDKKVVIKFNSKNTFGGYTKYDAVTVYYFAGEYKGDLDLYQDNDGTSFSDRLDALGFTSFSNKTSDSVDIKAWQINNQNPFLIISIVSSSITLVTGILFLIYKMKTSNNNLKISNSSHLNSNNNYRESYIEEIKKLKQLLEEGLITEDQFNLKRDKLIEN
jgi:hypothetical protein